MGAPQPTVGRYKRTSGQSRDATSTTRALRSRVSLTQRPQTEGSEGFSVIAFALSLVILALFSLRVVDGGVWLNIPGARHAGVPIE